MANINIVVISGNITRDPELRTSSSGAAVLKIGVAVNDSRKNQQTGQWEEYPNFIDCTMFGKRAEGISPYIRKGMKVTIKGKLRWSQWEDRNGGGKRSKVEVVIDEIELPPRNDSAGGQGQSVAPVQPTVQPMPQPQQMQQQQPMQQQIPSMQQPQAAQQGYSSNAYQANAQQYAQPQQMTAYDEDIPF